MFNRENGFENIDHHFHVEYEDQKRIERFLEEGGYKSVSEWAEDSDCTYDAEWHEWKDEHGNAINLNSYVLVVIENMLEAGEINY